MKIRLAKKYSLKWPLTLTSKSYHDDKKFRHVNWSIAFYKKLRKGDK